MFNGHRVSVGKYEKILNMDGNDGHTIMWMPLTSFS